MYVSIYMYVRMYVCMSGQDMKGAKRWRFMISFLPRPSLGFYSKTLMKCYFATEKFIFFNVECNLKDEILCDL